MRWTVVKKKKEKKTFKFSFMLKAKPPQMNTVNDSDISQTSRKGRMLGGSGWKEDERVHFSPRPQTAEKICGILQHSVQPCTQIDNVAAFCTCRRMWECDISGRLRQPSYESNTIQEW